MDEIIGSGNNIKNLIKNIPLIHRDKLVLFIKNLDYYNNDIYKLFKLWNTLMKLKKDVTFQECVGTIICLKVCLRDVVETVNDFNEVLTPKPYIKVNILEECGWIPNGEILIYDFNDDLSKLIYTSIKYLM